jgi:hypothetical protein
LKLLLGQGNSKELKRIFSGFYWKKKRGVHKN